jgi:hypothetical protein
MKARSGIVRQEEIKGNWVQLRSAFSGASVRRCQIAVCCVMRSPPEKAATKKEKGQQQGSVEKIRKRSSTNIVAKVTDPGHRPHKAGGALLRPLSAFLHPNSSTDPSQLDAVPVLATSLSPRHWCFGWQGLPSSRPRSVSLQF